MSMRKLFTTNKDLEVKGVEVDYGDFRVTIARAGGANKRFARLLESKTRPFRRAIQTETMDNDRANELLKEVYAEAIVLRWEVKLPDGKYKIGIEDLDDETKIVAFKPENVLRTFMEMDDLFLEIQAQANKVALFRETLLEDDAGN